MLLAAFGTASLLLLTSSGTSASNGSIPPTWAPLIFCGDVTGDGAVVGPDINKIVGHFGATVIKQDGFFVPGPNYYLLYDLTGDGGIVGTDINAVVADFGDSCPLVETQVAAATVALIEAGYTNPANAIADGYIQSSQYVPSMGIHMANLSNQVNRPDLDSANCDPTAGLSSTCQLAQPGGLLYTSNNGAPDVLIGAWYIVPVDPVCLVYGISGPCQPTDTQPVGFGMTNTDEDNLDPDGAGPQRGWHTHPNLCVWNWGTVNAAVQENVSEQECTSTGGSAWFSTYGWMVHLYNFVPNPDGRFQNWSCLIPGSVVSC
jgi:hypothetical protein